MQSSDLIAILHWWLILLVIDLLVLPFTIKIFSPFFDKGYIFAKVIGIAFISYLTFLLSMLHVAPFVQTTVIAVTVFIAFATNTASFFWAKAKKTPLQIISLIKNKWPIFLFEELLFLAGLLFWSYVRSTQPDIHGLEKFMDFGFINSILRSTYFPPKDMWFTPFPINYYYFGHLSTAVLTKLSGIPANITFNLMLATLFGLTFTQTFSLATTLATSLAPKVRLPAKIAGGLITAFFLTFGGNLHTIYTFFSKYNTDSPQPPWQMKFTPLGFPNEYWYPDATRFIYHTIHEFPMYSFVVSDLHGHVLDIMFVLTTIGLLLSIFLQKMTVISEKTKQATKTLFTFKDWQLNIFLLGFFIAVMYMTNAWDGMIYFLLAIGVIGMLFWQATKQITIMLKQTIILGASIACTAVVFALPFSLFFQPGLLVHGVGVLCTPDFLIRIGHIGPFLFEPDSCQRSPWWQLLILYGFFYFWIFSFLFFLAKKTKLSITQLILFTVIGLITIFIHPLLLLIWIIFMSIYIIKKAQPQPADIFVLLLINLSVALIVIPEFVYAKDIYPTYQRANTMFKLVYQSFMMLSLSSGYILIRMLTTFTQNNRDKIMFFITIIVAYLTLVGVFIQIIILKNLQPFSLTIILLFVVFFCAMAYVIFYLLKHLQAKHVNRLFAIPLIAWGVVGLTFITLIAIYPYFAITSYYNSGQVYGLDGTKYLQRLYPNDYAAIEWLNKNIKGQPVILEAQGDSYTDYARVSANTGLPTVLGWTVHEWLWRGSYDVPAPRITDAQTMYTTTDLNETKQLLQKYNVQYVFIGTLEQQKYPTLDEQKFNQLGKIVYQNGDTKIYKLNL